MSANLKVLCRLYVSARRNARKARKKGNVLQESYFYGAAMGYIHAARIEKG